MAKSLLKQLLNLITMSEEKELNEQRCIMRNLNKINSLLCLLIQKEECSTYTMKKEEEMIEEHIVMDIKEEKVENIAQEINEEVDIIEEQVKDDFEVNKEKMNLRMFLNILQKKQKQMMDKL